MRTVEVTRLINGEVVVESRHMADLRFRNQEDAHTWLALNEYKITGKAVRGRGDNISGFYVQPMQQSR